MPTLEEDKPDIVILCFGTNNLTKKRQSEREVTHEIIDVVNICHNLGVNKVYVSGILFRPAYKNKINEINRIIELNASTHDYIFIDNSNIQLEHLWRDKVHLNDKGTVLLANNFIDILNERSIYDDFF